MLAALTVAAALVLAQPPTDRLWRPPAARGARVSYTIVCDPAAPDPRVAVRVRASALDLVPGPITLHLPDHGEWTHLDGLYLRGLHARPPLQRRADDPARWDVLAPTGWDGTLFLSYTIPLTPRGSQLHERHGLLPWCADGPGGAPAYAVMLSENTLARIETGPDGPPIAADIAISPPAGCAAASGWGGTTPGAQRAHLPAGLHDGPVIVGSPRIAREDKDGVVCEVAQFAGEAEITAPVLDTAHALLAAYAATTGRALDRPMHVFITDKGGGQWTPGGLLLQVAHSTDEAASPHYRSLLAHELFHQWLGGYARAADPSLVWFQEGFTDYAALWHLAATGGVTQDWLVERLLELDAAARASDAYGKLAFGPAGPVWRDGNGANETLAYRGGAVLAFWLDAQLARQGGGGGPRLAAMIGDLGRADPGGTYTLDAIREWLSARGLSDSVRDFIDSPGLPSVDEALVAAGFERIPADLAYTGIAVAGGGPLGTVTAVDPDGPAAACGIRPGDVITGCWPCREVRPRVPPAAATEFRFGLDLFDPAAAGEVNVGVLRDGEDLTVKIRPRPRPGGFHWRAAGDGSRAAAFFALPRTGSGPP